MIRKNKIKSLCVHLTFFVLLLIPSTMLNNACVAPDVTCIFDDSSNPCLGPLEYLGQGEKNPMVLIFNIPFEDHDGDLGKGTLEVSINQEPSNIGGLDMRDVFHSNGLDYRTTQGVLKWSIELTSRSDTPNTGTQFTVGIRVRDQKEHVSNLQEITLQL